MEWITIHPNGKDSKGQPIPVKEGQSKKDAVKAFICKHQKGVEEDKNKSIDELRAKAQEVDNNEGFDVENKESGTKSRYYKKDNKYYSDYFEKYGNDYKQVGASSELAKEEYLAERFAKTLTDLGIVFNDYDISPEDGGTIKFYFNSPEEQTNAYKKLQAVLGNERSIMNFKDDLSISTDSHEESKVKRDSEKDAFVKNAIASGKYKGTVKEITEQIFQDSPYSIHSYSQIKELVTKYLNK